MSDLIRPKPASLPANPLAGIVARARAATPAHTGATERARARRDLVILADVSKSMEGTKHAALSASLDSVLIDTPDADRVAFSSLARPLRKGEPLPTPDGGTATHLALEDAAPYRRALVISDGAPDSAEQALRVAARLAAGGTRIDTLFIGSDGDHAGIDFMRRLAEVGRGSALNCDVVRQGDDRARLTSAVRQLALPDARTRP